MIKRMKEETGMLESKNIEEAFKKVDRANFVPPEYKGDAYLDQPLHIGEGQTISQPSTVAFMLELLGASEGEKVLDVGAGSGWTAALLAEIVGEDGEVVGIERVPDLVEFGKENLNKYGYSNVSIKEAGYTLGDFDNAPYDKILVSAAAREAPEELTEQLKERGVIVIPVRDEVQRIKKAENGNIETERYPGFAFVPLK